MPLHLQLCLIIAVMVARFAFAAERRILHLVPDEAGMLAMARMLSGGTRWNMFRNNTWQPGLSFLLAPLYWLTDSPTTHYRLSLIVVAGVAGVSAVVLARLIVVLTGLGDRASIVVAGVVAVAPSTFASTTYLWAESLVTLAFLGALWFALVHFRTGRQLYAFAAVVCAAAGYLSHNRMLPFLVTAVGWLVVASLARRSFRDAAWLAGAGLLSWVLVAWVSDTIIGRVWDDPDTVNTSGSTLSRLSHPGAVLEAVVGQVWYQLTATAGLFGIGSMVLVAGARRGRPRSFEYRTVLVFTGSMMVVSAIFVSGRLRADFLVYGRYNDAVVWPVIAVGIAQLLARGAPGRRATLRAVGATAVGTALVGTVVEVLHGDSIGSLPLTRPMIAGLLAITGSSAELDIVRLTSFAVVGLFGAALIAQWQGRQRGAVLLVAVLPLLVVGAFRTRDALGVLVNSGLRAGTVVEVEELLDEGEPLGIYFVFDSAEPRPRTLLVAQNRRAHYFQFFLPDHPMRSVDGLDAFDDIRYVFAPIDDPTMSEGGATMVWEDPVVEMALWREPT